MGLKFPLMSLSHTITVNVAFALLFLFYDITPKSNNKYNLPETVEMGMFLDPEIVEMAKPYRIEVMVEFLEPVAEIESLIFGSRNHRNASISESLTNSL